MTDNFKIYNTKEVRIGDIDAFCEQDSGVSAYTMDEYQFNALKRTNIGELKPNYDRVKTILGELSVKREFETIIQNKNCFCSELSFQIPFLLIVKIHRRNRQRYTTRTRHDE